MLLNDLTKDTPPSLETQISILGNWDGIEENDFVDNAT